MQVTVGVNVEVAVEVVTVVATLVVVLVDVDGSSTTEGPHYMLPHGSNLREHPRYSLPVALFAAPSLSYTYLSLALPVLSYSSCCSTGQVHTKHLRCQRET